MEVDVVVDVEVVLADGDRDQHRLRHVARGGDVDVGGGVPSVTVEVSTFSTMLIVDPAAPAVAWMVRFGVDRVPGATGPTVAKRIVSAAGNVVESAVVTPSIWVGRKP